MANLDEAAGQNVSQEAAHELICRQGHGGRLIGAGVVLPAKSHAAVFERDQALVGDGYPVGIARQVLQHLPGSAERRLGIDYPFGCGQPFKPLSKVPFFSQGLQLAMKAELASEESSLQIGGDFSPEETAE